MSSPNPTPYQSILYPCTLPHDLPSPWEHKGFDFWVTSDQGKFKKTSKKDMDLGVPNHISVELRKGEIGDR